FGGVEQMKEDCRDARGTTLVESIEQDLRYAARGLRKSPGFAIAAILILGLAIGANTAVFSVMNALLLKELPVEHPEALMTISALSLDHKPNQDLSYPIYREIAARQNVFSALYPADDNTKMNLIEGRERTK